MNNPGLATWHRAGTPDEVKALRREASALGRTSSITTLPALEIASGAASILSSSVALNLAGLTDACAGSLRARCKAARIQLHK